MRTPAFLSLSHDVGWTLLHFCWQGALVAVLLACSLSLLSRRSPQMRYVACCLALLVMAGLPCLTYIRMASSHPEAAEAVVGPLVLSSALGRLGGTTPAESWISQAIRGIDHSLPTVLILWCVGVLLILSRLGIGLAVARKIKSTEIGSIPHDLQVTFTQLLQRAIITRPVRLLASTLVEVPTLIGWMRPVILLPLACLSGLSSVQLEAVLAHELAHVRRHDYLINVLQSVIEALLFYHPAVWWVSRKIRAERESCCDDIAVKLVGDVLSYAKALSLLEEHRSTIPQPILEATGGVLVMRIKRLIGVEEKPALSRLAAVMVLALIGAGAVVGVSTNAKAQPKPVLQEAVSARSHSSDQALTGEYQKWLDEDVRWNITPAERTVFVHLSSDAERDHFIQQFWLSRDAAGAQPNSARSEHYKRIAYANQHFSAARPGWQTDRGRIYILYGAPSSIDAHPSDNPSGKPFEVWEYDNAMALGSHVELRFVDIWQCGDYELTPGHEATTTTSGLPDKALYDKGLVQIEQGKYEVARFTLQTLLNEYPSSPFTQSAQLAIATSWDQQGDTAAAQQAERAYDDANVKLSKIGGNVSAPILTFQANPEYSEAARAAKEQGNVLIGLWVDDQGRPSHLRVLKGAAKDLNERAVDAVRKYRFKPAMENGTPVLVAMSVEVNFSLF